jgi:hypothetical protein
MIRFKVVAQWLSVLAICVCLLPAQPKPQPPKSLRVYVFDLGVLDNPDISRYSLKRNEIGTHLMSVPSFLIVHPKGTLIWDTGAIPDSTFKPDGMPATLRYATSRATSPTWRFRTFIGTMWVMEMPLWAQRGWCGRKSTTSCLQALLRTELFRPTTARSRTAKR